MSGLVDTRGTAPPRVGPWPVDLQRRPSQRRTASVALAVAALGGAGAVHPPTLVLLAVLGGAAALLLLARPDTATLLVVGLVYVNAAVVMVKVQGAPSVLEVAVFAPLLLPLVLHLTVRREPVVWLRATSWASAYALVFLVSGLASPTMADTSTYLVTFLTEGYVLFLLLTNVVRTRAQLRRCLGVLVASGAFMGLVTLLQYLRGAYWTSFRGFGQVGGAYVADGTDWTSWSDGAPAAQPRLAGPIGEPNFFALVLLGVLPYALHLASTAGSRRARWAWWAAGALDAAGIVLSYSRGAIVAIVVTTVTLAVLRMIPRRSLLLPLAGVAVALALVPSYATRLSEVRNVLHLGGSAASSTSQQADPAAQGRFSEMVAGLEVFRDHPLLGVGPGQFPSYYQQYAGAAGNGVHAGEGDRQAHNLFVGIAAETGLLGLVTFFGLVAVVLRRLAELRRTPRFRSVATSATASLLLLLSASMFLHLAYLRYLWLHLAVTSVLPSVCRAVEPDEVAP